MHTSERSSRGAKVKRDDASASHAAQQYDEALRTCIQPKFDTRASSISAT